MWISLYVIGALHQKAIDILDQTILLWCTPSRKFCSIPGLYPLGAGGIPHPQRWELGCLLTLPSVPWGLKYPELRITTLDYLRRLKIKIVLSKMSSKDRKLHSPLGILGAAVSQWWHHGPTDSESLGRGEASICVFNNDPGGSDALPEFEKHWIKFPLFYRFATFTCYSGRGRKEERKEENPTSFHTTSDAISVT